MVTFMMAVLETDVFYDNFPHPPPVFFETGAATTNNTRRRTTYGRAPRLRLAGRVYVRWTRYVGRKFALQICIANGRKAFAIDDGRVNGKKIAKIFI